MTGSNYRDELVDKVRESNDIVSVVSEYVKLKKIGNRHVGLCPFHSERTPSFSVSADRQLFYCFGCHIGGNVFTFIMKMDGLTFQEAVRRLAERAGLDISSREEAPQERAARERRERSYAVNALAMAYYRQVLIRTKAAQQAREYLERRGVGPEAQERFAIGYAPQTWDALIRALETKGVTAQEVCDASLGVPNSDERSHGSHDRFRNRLIFPIVNVYGRVVGFGGRSLGEDTPKYLNSPESAVFAKRANLYGINIAADSIRTAGDAVVVEGYMDVVAAHQAGEGNVVASLGTALTPEQVRLISRYASRIVICYDADAAGAQATMRGIGTARDAGLEVRVASLPDGHDPDSLVRAKGGDALRTAIQSAVPFARHQVERAIAQADPSDFESRVRAARAAIEVIAGVDDEVERTEYIRELSGRLQVDPSAFTTEVRKQRARRAAQQREARAGARRPAAGAASRTVQPAAAESVGTLGADDSVSESKAYLEVESALIRLAALGATNRARVIKEVGQDGFRVAANQELFRLLCEQGMNSDSLSAAELIDMVPADLKSHSAAVLFGAKPWEGEASAAERTIAAWRQFTMKRRLSELDVEIREADASGEDQRVSALQQEQQRLRGALGPDVTIY
ncbi:MAG: DNA primase [Clostridia bacterium]|nr:DNA primase [Clostridia bacterium]